MQNPNRMNAIAIAVALSHFIDTDSWGEKADGTNATRDTANYMIEMLLALTVDSPNADVATVNTLAKVVHIGVINAPFATTKELFAVVAILLATGSESDINFLIGHVIGHVELGSR